MTSSALALGTSEGDERGSCDALSGHSSGSGTRAYRRLTGFWPAHLRAVRTQERAGGT